MKRKQFIKSTVAAGAVGMVAGGAENLVINKTRVFVGLQVSLLN